MAVCVVMRVVVGVCMSMFVWMILRVLMMLMLMLVVMVPGVPVMFMPVTVCMLVSMVMSMCVAVFVVIMAVPVPVPVPVRVCMRVCVAGAAASFGVGMPMCFMPVRPVAVLVAGMPLVVRLFMMVRVAVCLIVVMCMIVPMPMVVVVLVVMAMLVFMAVIMVMPAAAAIAPQALVVERIGGGQSLFIQQGQRTGTVASVQGRLLDPFGRHAFAQQGKPLVEVRVAYAVDDQPGTGRGQGDAQAQLHEQVGGVADLGFAARGQHHQFGRAGEVETHRDVVGGDVFEPVCVGGGGYRLQLHPEAAGGGCHCTGGGGCGTGGDSRDAGSSWRVTGGGCLHGTVLCGFGQQEAGALGQRQQIVADAGGIQQLERGRGGLVGDAHGGFPWLD